MTTWFQGESPRAADAEATATADGRELSATFTEDEVSGTLAFADETTTFTAIRATRESPAGLFQNHSNGCRAGLIVPDTGSGDAQGAYCKDFTATGKPTLRIFEQVTPVAPIDLRDGFVKARGVDSSNLVIHLTPILLPLDST